MERDAFLSRVRAGIDHSTLPPTSPDDPGLLIPDLDAVDLLDQFATALDSLSGTLHRDGLDAAVDAIVAAHGPGPLLSWDASELPIGNAIDRFTGAGCEPVDGIVPAGAVERLSHQRTYFDLKYGLTGAEAAFAETGTIVVRSGAGRPRMASLIPLVHIVLLPEHALFRSPMHWLAGSNGDVAGAANVVYITGPSRTADIEQQINLGVHGPREVHIVLV